MRRPCRSASPRFAERRSRTPASPIIREAAIYAPNTYFTEFTARKLSNPRFRGIGSSPANPGITTYLDGVPQLNANSSSIDLIDVEQVEFVRGPQSALFGRNTLGGVINVTSARPSLSDWTRPRSRAVRRTSTRVRLRASVSGPLAAGRVGVGAVVQVRAARRLHDQRPSPATTSTSRDGVLGKAQLLWTPSATWETRVIVTGERARDGDYALSDLGGLRDQSVPDGARLRGAHRSRHHRDDGPGAPDGQRAST